MCWNEWKINFPSFANFIFPIMVDLVLKINRKWTNFELKNDHISKIKNRNDRKIDYSFVLAHCASFINFWPFLRGEGCLHILTWDRAKLVFILKIISTFAKNNCIQSFFSSSITRADQKYVISLRNVQHRKSLHNNTLKHLMTVQRTRQEMGQRTPQITPKTDWTNHSDQAHSCSRDWRREAIIGGPIWAHLSNITVLRYRGA